MNKKKPIWLLYKDLKVLSFFCHDFSKFSLYFIRKKVKTFLVYKFLKF